VVIVRVVVLVVVGRVVIVVRRVAGAAVVAVVDVVVAAARLRDDVGVPNRYGAAGVDGRRVRDRRERSALGVFVRGQGVCRRDGEGEQHGEHDDEFDGTHLVPP